MSTITLELTPQEEERVRSAAAKRGLPAREFVKARILEAIASTESVETPENDALWDQWAAVGQDATEAARTDLRIHGISSVYRRDGVVVEESPDGTVRPISSIR